jgi:hypothetical protein
MTTLLFYGLIALLAAIIVLAIILAVCCCAPGPVRFSFLLWTTFAHLD